MPVVTDPFTEAEWLGLATALELTPRQREMAQLICKGRDYKSMAVEAGISVNTVRMHMRALFAKVGVHDQVGLVLHLVGTSRRLAVATRMDGARA